MTYWHSGWYRKVFDLNFIYLKLYCKTLIKIRTVLYFIHNDVVCRLFFTKFDILDFETIASKMYYAGNGVYDLYGLYNAQFAMYESLL